MGVDWEVAEEPVPPRKPVMRPGSTRSTDHQLVRISIALLNRSAYQRIPVYSYLFCVEYQTTLFSMLLALAEM